MKIAIPLIAALKSLPQRSPFQDLSVDEVERDIFPVQLVHLDMVRTGAEAYQSTWVLLDRARAVLEKQLNDVLKTLRERFEGEDMPLGLDDEGVLKWLEERMQSQQSTMPEH